MAEISDEAYLEQHPEHRELDPAIRAQLRQNAQLQADLDAERATRSTLERRAAFAEAGLADLPVRELFEKSYTGELTAEAIKAEAEKYGLTGTVAPVIEPENRNDLNAIQRVQQASSGAVSGVPMDFGDAIDRARSDEELDAILAMAPPEAGIRLRGTVQGSRLI